MNAPTYTIQTNFIFCNGTYLAKAIGPDFPENAVFKWRFRDLASGAQITATGRTASIYCPFSLGSFSVLTTLTVEIPGCGTFETNDLRSSLTCNPERPGDEPGLVVYPNPGSNEITIFVTNNHNEDFFNERKEIQIYDLNTGHLVKRVALTSNTKNINVFDLKEGAYNLRLVDPYRVISTSLTIQR